MKAETRLEVLFWLKVVGAVVAALGAVFGGGEVTGYWDVL